MSQNGSSGEGAGLAIGGCFCQLAGAANRSMNAIFGTGADLIGTGVDGTTQGFIWASPSKGHLRVCAIEPLKPVDHTQSDGMRLILDLVLLDRQVRSRTCRGS